MARLPLSADSVKSFLPDAIESSAGVVYVLKVSFDASVPPSGTKVFGFSEVPVTSFSSSV